MRRTSVGDATGSPETVDTTLTAPAGTELVAVIDLPVMVSARVGNVLPPWPLPRWPLDSSDDQPAVRAECASEETPCIDMCPGPARAEAIKPQRAPPGQYPI